MSIDFEEFERLLARMEISGPVDPDEFERFLVEFGKILNLLPSDEVEAMLVPHVPLCVKRLQTIANDPGADSDARHQARQMLISRGISADMSRDWRQ